MPCGICSAAAAAAAESPPPPEQLNKGERERVKKQLRERKHTRLPQGLTLNA